MSFEGFPQTGLDFLRELGENDKTWFDERRAIYDRDVVAPAKAFVTAMGERLETGIAPNIVALPKANGSIAPINNDLRFSPDKSPYKDHLMFRFWEGADKKSAPTLMIRFNADDVGFASGIMLGDLNRWRGLVGDEQTGSALVAAISAVGSSRDLDVAGIGYKKVPKPYPDDHPRANLLRHKDFQVRWSEPAPANVTDSGFVDFCADRLERFADVHAWLREHL